MILNQCGIIWGYLKVIPTKKNYKSFEVKQHLPIQMELSILLVYPIFWTNPSVCCFLFGGDPQWQHVWDGLKPPCGWGILPNRHRGMTLDVRFVDDLVDVYWFLPLIHQKNEKGDNSRTGTLIKISSNFKKMDPSPRLKGFQSWSYFIMVPSWFFGSTGWMATSST